MAPKSKKTVETKVESIQKVEAFNGETVPVVEDTPTGMNHWTDDDKVDSIMNTIKILPPNMIKDGRHDIRNVQALNCFRVTEELMDAAYSKFTHDEY